MKGGDLSLPSHMSRIEYAAVGKVVMLYQSSNVI